MNRPIPKEIRRTVENYCREAVPEHAQDRLRMGYLVKSMAVTLFELRPPFRDPSNGLSFDAAGFGYNKTKANGTRYWPDRNMNGLVYESIAPTHDFGVLLQAVMDDPTPICWG